MDIMCPGLAHPACFESSVFRSTTLCFYLLKGDHFLSLTTFSKIHSRGTTHTKTEYHGPNWRYAPGLVDLQLLPAHQLPVIVGCIQRHLRKTYFYTCESGGKDSSVLKTNFRLLVFRLVTVVHVTRKSDILIIWLIILEPLCPFVNSKHLICEVFLFFLFCFLINMTTTLVKSKSSILLS